MKTLIITFIILLVSTNVKSQNWREIEKQELRNDSLQMELTYSALNETQLDEEVGRLIKISGKKQKHAFFWGLGGMVGGVLVGAISYDKNKKEISPLTFIPIIGGVIGTLYNLFDSWNSLDDAGELIIYKAKKFKK